MGNSDNITHYMAGYSIHQGLPEAQCTLQLQAVTISHSAHADIHSAASDQLLIVAVPQIPMNHI